MLLRLYKLTFQGSILYTLSTRLTHFTILQWLYYSVIYIGKSIPSFVIFIDHRWVRLKYFIQKLKKYKWSIHLINFRAYGEKRRLVIKHKILLKPVQVSRFSRFSQDGGDPVTKSGITVICFYNASAESGQYMTIPHSDNRWFWY